MGSGTELSQFLGFFLPTFLYCKMKVSNINDIKEYKANCLVSYILKHL